MLDPMLTLIVAKAKAVGLVAGTAMLTTALVGGGAVAMTAVSSETDADPSASQEAEPIELEALEGVSDTPTVDVKDEEQDAPEVEEVETEESQVKVRPPLPGDFVCDDSKNHGQNVSTFARSLEKGPGRGEQVSAVAQSDCGKKAKDESAEESVETESAETEVEDSAPKPDKPAKAAKQKPAGKPAKAEKKPAKK